ncbi:MAG TPA: N-acetylmuramoyl-L-alanine amidase [Acidobacteriaceae bacterium]|nr:N-acetylmuramoyl-L-alanine amidase [Acidobacteriaceae bacterium]
MPLLFCHRFSRRLGAVACLASLSVGIFLLFPRSAHASTSHHLSEINFARAIAIRRRLEAVPERDRTRTQYERALEAYRAVYHGDPASPDAPRSIAAVADLLAGAGRCFHQKKLFHDAVEQWEFLRRQYPTSSLRQQALLEEAQIQQHDLHDRAGAKKNYRLFLTKYPHHPLVEQARAGLQEKPTATPSALHESDMKQAGALPTGRLVTTTSPAPEQQSQIQPGSSSKVIWVDNDPDSKPARTAPKTAGAVKTSPSAAILNDVRYWDESGSTRIAINLTEAVPYHIYSDQNGSQLTIVFFGIHSAEALLNHPIVASHDENLRSLRVSMLTRDQATVLLQMKRPVSFSSFDLSNPSRLILDLQPAMATDFAQTVSAPIRDTPTQAPKTVASETPITPPPNGKPLGETKRMSPPPKPPSHAAETTPTVQPSMARVLGLRVRRIVIDAGHGGHDSGTIGEGGIEEKDIALDVALRLGHLLQQRMGAQVIYTRRTDKYVPLEERTAIANAAHADLFLSIHANSSSDPDVRGVETYFLNFTTSPDAMAVAGRENADSNRSVYELSDLVRKIALSDKVDESREFAGDVQEQLYSGLLSGNPGLKNRGVKQAPFVVLIGAQMPSILAEISFLTNPEDASELTRPRYQERLAEALYRGVAEYVDGMSGVRIAKTIPAEALAAPAE